MAVIEDEPNTGGLADLDHFQSRPLLLFAHGYLVHSWLLLFAGKLVNVIGWVRTRGKQIQDRCLLVGFLVNVRDLISHRHRIFLAEHLANKLVTGKDRAILTAGADQAKMEEVANGLVCKDLVLVVGNWGVLWFVLVKELFPFLFEPSNALRQVLEEEVVLISKLVFTQGHNIQPGLLVHPVVLFVAVVNTGTSLEEHTDICVGECLRLDEDLHRHHQFERHLVALE